MRIGILGGTFDPIHKGHVYLAEKVYQKLGLDTVIFIPAYTPPHKKGIKVTPARHRYKMLKLALSAHKEFKISDMEIKRKGRSYSVDTLRRLKRRYGAKAEFFFITGSDALKEIDKWKNLEEILKLCKFVVVERPGFKAEKHPEGFIFLKVNAMNISATAVRNAIKANRALTGITPRQKAPPVKAEMNRAGSGFAQANPAIKDATAVKPWSFTDRSVAGYISRNKLYI